MTPLSFEYFPLTGRILISDDGAHVVFDSAEEMLSVKPADVRAGSQVVPARVASSQGVDGQQIVVDVEVDYPLAAIEVPGAKVVRGMMRSTWASNPEPGDGLWRQASGTHLDLLDGVSTTQVPQSDLSGYNRVATLGGYTFFVNEAGVLVLRERIVMRARDRGGPPQFNYRGREQATIEFRLLIGFFLGADFAARPALSIVKYDTFIASNAASWSGSIDFGGGFSARKLLLGFVTGTAGQHPVSATINGVAANIRLNHTGNAGGVALIDADVTAGGAVPVTVNLNATGFGARLFALVGRNLGGTVSTFTANTANGTSLSVGMNVAVDEAGVTLCAVNPYFRLTSMVGGSGRQHQSDYGIAGVTQSGANNGSVTANVQQTFGNPVACQMTMCGYKFS